MKKFKIYNFCLSLAIFLSINIYSQNSNNNISPKIKQELEQMYLQQQQKQFSANPSNTELGNKSEPIERLVNNQNLIKDTDIPIGMASDELPKRFGQSFFSQEISTFAPVDNINVPDDYVIGLGDSLVIQLMGTTNERLELPLDRDGSIFIESLGVMNLAGLTIEQVIQLLENKVSNELFGTTVSVTLGKLKAINVFLTGESKNPGMYSISSLSTITQALYQSGGISELGSIRNINVLRNGLIVKTFDAYDLLINGDSSGDIRLKSGDVILIPPYQSIAEVKGGTKRPMIYEVLPGETVADLIKISAGYSQQAFSSDAFLITKRDITSSPETLNIDLLSKADLDIKLGINDILIIPLASNQPTDSIEIIGAAYRNGNIGWAPGMHLTDIINDLEKDFPPFVDLDFSLIVRKPDRLSKYNFIDFSLRDIYENQSFVDIELLENDKIIFFSTFLEAKTKNSIDNDFLSETDQSDTVEGSHDVGDMYLNSTYNNDLKKQELSREKLLAPLISIIKSESSINNPVRLVSISGEVKFPGIYPLFDDAIAQDLLNAAGGMNDDAYAPSIELKRNVTSQSSYTSIQIELDASKGSQDIYTTKLQSLDHLTVRKMKGRNENKKVLLTGEINFPGEYVISENESLSSVLERAGGLTSTAFPNGAIFLSKIAKLNELKQLEDYKNQLKKNFSSTSFTQEAQSNFAVDDLTKIVDLLSSIQPTGRISIYLNADNLDEIIVEDGDSFHVPTKLSYVNVVGEVNVNNSLNYEKTFSIEDYINMSGGFTARADQDAVYLIKANGKTIVLEKSSFKFFRNKPIIEQGDTIIVPVNIQFKDSLTNWTQITQLIYQSMVSIAAVKGL